MTQRAFEQLVMEFAQLYMACYNNSTNPSDGELLVIARKNLLNAVAPIITEDDEWAPITAPEWWKKGQHLIKYDYSRGFEI